ncbi:hypothetical protein N0V82_008555 [Gnomoniopsis sp. IMI 355080]|nr:hypothetical protein N0V82_008555 [Gnomoniopsis sp. IMI 355080]
MTCPTGYSSCPASLNGGCCANGMGCAVESCYTLSPATTTLTYTTTEDGTALTVTSTSVTTPTPTTISTVSGDGAVAKFFPSTVSKTEATASAGSSSDATSGGGGLSKGAIGGIVAAAALILVAVLVAAFFIIKRLKHTEQVVQVHGDTTSGTRTRQTTEKKSEVNVRVIPTPSEVDAMDYDPLMMNSSVASPQRPGHQPHMAHNRARGGSDTASQPSLWSGQSATRWNTPSVNSDAADDNVYFELPPRAYQHPEGRPAIRQSVNSNDSAYSYHNFANAHGRNASNASELSTGSDDNGSQHGIGSPLMPIELGVDGEFRPELPGTGTDLEGNSGYRQRRPRRAGTATSINDMVSPMSMRPGAAPPASRQRRRGNSQTVSPMEGRPTADGSGRSGLGSIDESASRSATQSLHGHYGPAIGGPEIDFGNPPPVPGFVPLDRPSQDESERQ